MIFARKVWHLLVGIKDALVLVMALMFFVALYMVPVSYTHLTLPTKA